MKDALRPIRAVAFDLDGTLVDSAPDIQHALNCSASSSRRCAPGSATARMR
jgi:phosphoglycolate phosphatase-like HAD superfamily hydrolase